MNDIAIRSDKIKEVRGRGLLLAVELHEDLGGARPICIDLMRRGLLCKETHVHTIRFAPPLNVTKDELDWAFARIEAVKSYITCR